MKSLADDFSKSQDDGPAKSRSVKSAGTGTRKETFKYLDDKGNTYKRPPRAEGKQWTEAQKKKYRSKD